jgi:hypothetical protein
MKDVTAEESAKNSAKNGAKTSAKNSTKDTGTAATLDDGAVALHQRYGQIGISAVAAAVRYQGAAKNPAYAPVPINWHDRGGEAA